MAPIEVLNWLESNYKRKEPTPLEMTRFSDEGTPEGPVLTFLSPIPVGQRNDRLFRWGCGLARGVHTGKVMCMNPPTWQDKRIV